MSALGELKRHWLSDALGTDYDEFVSPLGIRGLAKVTDRRVELLALLADKPGSGAFRSLVDACKREFDEIEVQEIMEPVVTAALKRYGFRHFTRTRSAIVALGGEVSGMRWRKPKQVAP